MDAFNESRFHAALNEAIVSARQVLGSARDFAIPGDVHHKYNDKYALAETQLSSLVACSLQGIQTLGLTADQVTSLSAWARDSSEVTLRFSFTTGFTFIRKETREEKGNALVTKEEKTSMFSSSDTSKTTTTYVITKVTEYFWSAKASWKLEAYKGTGRNPGDTLLISSRDSASVEIKTGSESCPFHGSTGSFDTPLTWLLQQVDGSGKSRVNIDRTHKECHTPRRNAQVEAALTQAQNLHRFFQQLESTLHHTFFPVERASRAPGADPTLCKVPLDASGVFVPGVLFVDAGDAPTTTTTTTPPPALPSSPSTGGAAIVTLGGSTAPSTTTTTTTTLVTAPEPSVVMDLTSINALCSESFSALVGRCDAVKGALPSPTSPSILSGAEGCLLVAGHFIRRVLEHGMDGVGYIESLLMQQVVAAIGKHLQPGDFDDYMKFHARKLFRPAFQPKPLCFSVRRSPEHSPEGTLRIDDVGGAGGGGAPTPIVSVSAAVGVGAGYMDFALNAQTRVRFGGERHLHAWLAHKFGVEGGDGSSTGAARFCGGPPPPPPPTRLSLVASTRQFSSFIVCVGKIVSATTFEPTSAFIVADKDEMSVPLEVSELPTPKEFKDAIASLSPNQQAFAKAFRAMQLESTLFGVLVLHIKPALEALLKLTPDSLTKEVALTQDLQELLIKYQIPSDLLSYAGPEGEDKGSRLTAVKGHVAAMKAMIKACQDEELAAAKKEAEYEKARLAKEELEHQMMLQQQMQQQNMVPQMAERRMMKSSAMSARSMAMPCAMPMGMGMGMPMAMMSAPAPPPMAMMMRGGGGAPPMMMMADSMADSGGAGWNSAAAECESAPAPSTRGEVGGASSTTTTSSSSAASSTTTTGAKGPGQGVGDEDDGSSSSPSGTPLKDLTKVPQELDTAYETHDSDSCLRASIIAPNGPWSKKFQASLLAKPSETTLGADEQGAAKHKAFDLLDALTRSGALPMENAALHVIMGATHRFEESLMDTVVKGNINPIEKVERSLLIMASTLHGLPAASLVQRDKVARLTEVTPTLFLAQ